MGIAVGQIWEDDATGVRYRIVALEETYAWVKETRRPHSASMQAHRSWFDHWYLISG